MRDQMSEMVKCYGGGGGGGGTSGRRTARGRTNPAYRVRGGRNAAGRRLT